MLGQGVKRFIHREAQPDRPAGSHREEHHQRFHLAVAFGAKSPADHRGMNPHLMRRKAEHARKVIAKNERILIAGPDFDAAFFRQSDVDVRLQMIVMNPGEMKRVGEYVIGPRYLGFSITSRVAKFVERIFTRLLQTLRTLADDQRRAPGGFLENIGSGRIQRIFYRHQRRQLLILDID
jgi:hypothetical protein